MKLRAYQNEIESLQQEALNMHENFHLRPNFYWSFSYKLQTDQPVSKGKITMDSQESSENFHILRPEKDCLHPIEIKKAQKDWAVMHR